MLVHLLYRIDFDCINNSVKNEILVYELQKIYSKTYL
jgi:hypothetical protein